MIIECQVTNIKPIVQEHYPQLSKKLYLNTTFPTQNGNIVSYDVQDEDRNPVPFKATIDDDHDYTVLLQIGAVHYLIWARPVRTFEETECNVEDCLVIGLGV